AERPAQATAQEPTRGGTLTSPWRTSGFSAGRGRVTPPAHTMGEPGGVTVGVNRIGNRCGRLPVIPRDEAVGGMTGVGPGRRADAGADEANAAIPEADVDPLGMAGLSTRRVAALVPNRLRLELQALGVAFAVPVLSVGVVMAEHGPKA